MVFIGLVIQLSARLKKSLSIGEREREKENLLQVEVVILNRLQFKNKPNMPVYREVD